MPVILARARPRALARNTMNPRTRPRASTRVCLRVPVMLQPATQRGPVVDPPQTGSVSWPAGWGPLLWISLWKRKVLPCPKPDLTASFSSQAQLVGIRGPAGKTPGPDPERGAGGHPSEPERPLPGDIQHPGGEEPALPAAQQPGEVSSALDRGGLRLVPHLRQVCLVTIQSCQKKKYPGPALRFPS